MYQTTTRYCYSRRLGYIPSFYSLLIAYLCYKIVLPHFIGIHGFLLQDWRFWPIHISYLFTSRALPPLGLNVLVFIYMSLLSKICRVDNCLSFQYRIVTNYPMSFHGYISSETLGSFFLRVTCST